MNTPSLFDAHKPSEIATLVETAGVTKAKLRMAPMFVLAMLAGAFIGFGAAAYTMAVTGADSAAGPIRVLGGAVFSLGLILVIAGGAELFTGNVLMVIAAVDRKIPLRLLFRSWGIVYAGNFVGALGLALAFSLTGLLEGPMGNTAVVIADAKAGLEPMEAFARGALCNGLVCLAVWLSFAARSVAGKFLAVLWPVTAFVLLGLEHSIANMFFFPQGWAAGATVPVFSVATNLLWVTLGNIVGGAGGVALAYWFAYLGATKG